MHDVTAHLMENVFPDAPVRQFVLSGPWELAPLLATRAKVFGYLIRLFVQSVSRQMKEAVGLLPGEKAHVGAVAFLQRFTKSLGLFPHVHVVFVDGVYVETVEGSLEFRQIPPPSPHDLLQIAKEVLQKMERYLKRNGYLDSEDTERLSHLEKWLLRGTAEPGVKATEAPTKKQTTHSIEFGGYSIHAGVRIKASDTGGREKLLRYAARPPFAEDQLSIVDDEEVELTLRSSRKGEARKVALHPVQLLRRLCWLVPPPGLNMTRYYGLFAPTHKRRADVVPGTSTRRLVNTSNANSPYRIAWAKLLAKVYDVDAQACPDCGHTLRPAGAITEYRDAALCIERGLSVLYATGPPDIVAA